MKQINSVYDLQENNLKRVLELLMESDGLTRQDLSERTGLSPAGISKIIRNLITKGLVYEDRVVKRRKGRRAISLKINPDSMYAVGIRFARNYIKCGFFNAKGELLSSELEVLEDQTAERAVEAISELIKKTLSMHHARRDRVMGIGISAPGPLFAHEGRIVLISNAPGWRNISLSRLIEEQFGIPTLVEHDANVSVLAEYWYGQGRGMKNLVYVVADRGVGAGVLVDGSVYRGNQNIAGEIGHTTIDFDGPQCDCGNRGCLEMYSSSLSFLRKARRIARMIQPAGWPDEECLTSDKIFTLAAQGDRVAVQLVEEFGRFMGIGIVNIINAFNPDMIVLGDEMARGGHIWLDALKEVVQERTISDVFESTQIVLSDLEPEPSFLGTGRLVIVEAFNNLASIMDG
jgi:predicted NBD/HSP70 family sugar kinase